MSNSKNERQKSCFSDQPIKSSNDDLLKNNQYAKALLDFIKTAEAPLTVGIQGGWGSGKTSLINLLQHELEASGNSLCININAWQQSLFVSTGRSGEIAISLLESAYSELVEQVRKNQGAGNLRITEEQKQSIVRLGKTVVRLTAAFSGVPLPAESQNTENGTHRFQAFKQLRQNMEQTIRSIVEDPANDLERVVIFVDDLDRIQPEIAVEVLDVLKNIFDINNCISVLAIDYDVVIKGLRKKFGDYDENKREFRQYFDKIIQIPFSMPVGAYRNNIPELLEHLIESLLPDVFLESEHDLILEAEDNYLKEARKKELLEEISNILLLATDGVPRSIKRIVNTASLLSIIDQAKPQEQGRTSQSELNSKSLYLKILLTVVSLQVAFPDIHKALTKLPVIDNWNLNDCKKAWLIPSEEISANNSYLEENLEEYELPLVLLIEQSGLISKLVEILDIIRILKDYSDSSNPGGLQVLRKVLRASSITDTDTTNNIQSISQAAKKDIHNGCKQLLEELVESFGEHVFGRINQVRTTKDYGGEWVLEHYGCASREIKINAIERVDITLNTNTEDGIPYFFVEFLIPKASEDSSLYESIVDLGFLDPERVNLI